MSSRTDDSLKRPVRILSNALNTARGRPELLALLLVYLIVMLRIAWMSDDAFITLRTVDNFVNGRGLTWNVIERVQTYTHPLWMFLLSAVYYFTEEPYYTTIFISVAFSLAAVATAAFSADSRASAALMVWALCLSKGFMDYSTSGLEDPLSHFLLAVFLVVFYRSISKERPSLFLLSFIAGLATLNRMDTVLIYFPVLLYLFWKNRSTASALKLIAGFIPFIAWEAFSVFYYGLLFPNTAYAKLNTGIPAGELATQGLYYLLDSLKHDPLTMTIVVVGLAVPFLKKERALMSFSLGGLLYLAYIVKVGGDFMSGRFLTVPFFLSAILLSKVRLSSPKVITSTVIAITVLGFIVMPPPLLSSSDYGANRHPNFHRIADERAFYYSHTGLFGKDRTGNGPSHEWVAKGLQFRKEKNPLYLTETVGMIGYYAGPDTHFIDPYALTDPLLSHLPVRRDKPWRTGHFERFFPRGYVGSVYFRKNLIEDPSLSAFYNRILFLTRAPLTNSERLKAIWEVNTGKLDNLIDKEKYKYPEKTGSPQIVR